jgi:hypothetical protein
MATPEDVRSRKHREQTGVRGAPRPAPPSASGGRGCGIGTTSVSTTATGAASTYLDPYIKHSANPKEIRCAAVGFATIQKIMLSATPT